LLRKNKFKIQLKLFKKKKQQQDFSGKEALKFLTKAHFIVFPLF